MINFAIYVTGIPLILLPFLILFVGIILSIFWLLIKLKIIDANKTKQILHFTRGIILSLLGVLVFVVITQFAILVIQSILPYISK